MIFGINFRYANQQKANSYGLITENNLLSKLYINKFLSIYNRHQFTKISRITSQNKTTRKLLEHSN